MEHIEEAKWASAVAETIRAERGVSKLSQAEVARRARISRSSYRLYEEGERQPDAVQLASIAQVLGVRLSYLVSEIERRATM